MIRRLGFMALASLSLGACAELASLEQRLATAVGGAERTAASDRDGAKTPVVNPHFDGHDFGQGPEPQIVTAPPPAPRRKPDRAEPAARAAPDPDLLVGLDFEATKALLGSPAISTEQPPAKVWAYNGGSCTFSVFFYPSMDDNVFRVLTYEVTGKGSELEIQTASRSGDAVTGTVKIRDRAHPVLRRCFAELLHEREPPDAG